MSVSLNLDLHTQQTQRLTIPELSSFFGSQQKWGGDLGRPMGPVTPAFLSLMEKLNFQAWPSAHAKGLGVAEQDWLDG